MAEKETGAVQDLNPNFVTFGTPVEGGSAFTSFKEGAKTPTDATTKMSTLKDFESLGELSDNGYTVSTSVENAEQVGWHGRAVISAISKETNTFKVEFIEINRASVAKLKYGEKAVTAGPDGGVASILGGRFDGRPHPFVFDELESSGHLRRTVFKRAVVTSFEDESHTRGAAVMYTMTFTALEPDDGSAPFEVYRAKPSE